ncbi:MAG: hypothetical protein ACO3JL_04405 [Myxococcota bacterium]
MKFSSSRRWTTGVLGMLVTGCSDTTLYEVTMTMVLRCDIRPNGEFCGDPSPPVNQTFVVEHQQGNTLVYFDEEAWVAQGEEGELLVTKVTAVTREPGPCTTSSRRELRFQEEASSLTGTLSTSTRIEGPDSCGETPRGTREVISLTGYISDRL